MLLLSLGKTLKHALEKHAYSILESGKTTIIFNLWDLERSCITSYFEMR